MSRHEYRLMFAVWKTARDFHGTALHPDVLAIMFHIDRMGPVKEQS